VECGDADNLKAGISDNVWNLHGPRLSGTLEPIRTFSTRPCPKISHHPYNPDRKPGSGSIEPVVYPMC
jgi:hypothetical protein